MNISDAKTLSLPRFVEHFGGTYSHTDGKQQLWYLSPFRPKERTASFKVDEALGRWIDFGPICAPSGQNRGDIIDLWCDLHGKDRRSGVMAALEGLQAFAVGASGSIQRPVPRVEEGPYGKADEEPPFRIVKLHERIFFPSMIEALQQRRIDRTLADAYLKQVYLQDTQNAARKWNGFAFANDSGGYEISCPNPGKGSSFKTSTRPKSPTTFRAALSSKLFVFEGFWDFLSWMEMQDTLEIEHNVIVLNSLSFCTRAIELIIAAKEQIDTVMLFLDHDDAGVQATLTFCEKLEQAGFTVRSMDTLYKGYKDLSDYWCRDPDAKKVTERKDADAKYYTDDSAWTLGTGQNKNRPRHL